MGSSATKTLTVNQKAPEFSEALRLVFRLQPASRREATNFLASPANLRSTKSAMTEDQPKRPFISRRCAFMLFVFAIPLLVLIALLFALSDPASKKLNITVSFLGYTNGSNGIRLASFGITNLSQKTVVRLEHCYREDTSVMLVGYNYIPYRGASAIPATNSLARGQSEVVHAVVPNTNLRWRVEFLFFPRGLHLRFVEWHENHKLGALESIIPKRWKHITPEIFSSDWIYPEVPAAKP